MLLSWLANYLPLAHQAGVLIDVAVSLAALQLQQGSDPRGVCISVKTGPAVTAAEGFSVILTLRLASFEISCQFGDFS